MKTKEIGLNKIKEITFQWSSGEKEIEWNEKSRKLKEVI